MGRHRRDPIEQIRSKGWSRSVARISGLSWYGLNKRYSEKGFGQNQQGANGRPTNWEKYNRNGVVPSSALVNRVAQDCPGTRMWFAHPFWNIACEKILDLTDVLNWIQTNSPSTGAKISFEENNSLKFKTMPATIDSLRKNGDLLSLGTLIALVRLAWHCSDGELYFDAAEATLYVLILNLSQTELACVEEELFDHIKFNFLSTTLNENINFFSQYDDINKYTQSLEKSLEFLMQRGVIKDNLSSKAKVSYFLWQEYLIYNGEAILHVLGEDDQRTGIAKILKLMSIDGRTDKRSMTRFQILKMSISRICINEGRNSSEILELVHNKLVPTCIRPTIYSDEK